MELSAAQHGNLLAFVDRSSAMHESTSHKEHIAAHREEWKHSLFTNSRNAQLYAMVGGAVDVL